MVAERRAHSRVKGPFEGFWDGSGTLTGRIVDLSVGGCFVEAVTPPVRPGETVTISLVIAGGQATLTGEVLYIEPHLGFAVRFLDPPPAIVERLATEVASRLGK